MDFGVYLQVQFVKLENSFEDSNGYMLPRPPKIDRDMFYPIFLRTSFGSKLLINGSGILAVLSVLMM
jgi:hypothetical protein